MLDSRSSKLKVVDLFCGAGGLSEGFRQAGFQILAGADQDPDACATYATNFRSATAVCGNIRTRNIRERFLEKAHDADVIVGGPPCQAFSQVRNHSRLIDDPRNSLYREFVKVVAEAAPMAFVMENVPGLQQMGAKEQVLEDLSIEGQYLVQAQLLDAVDFGVPQTRKRLFFIGIRRSIGLAPPKVIGSGASSGLTLTRDFHNGRPRYRIIASDRLYDRPLLDRLLDPDDASIVSAEQAISDLARLRVGSREDCDVIDKLSDPMSAYQRHMRESHATEITNVSVPRINGDTKMRLDGLPPGGNYRDLSEALTARYLTGQKWGPHNGSGQLGRKHYYAYRKLYPQFWSWTLNTKADSVYHYKAVRALSVREFARLQSFPDSFIFTTDSRRGPLSGRMDGGAAHSRYRQAGNAVPPLLSRAVARAIAKLLQRTEPRSKTA